MFLNKSHIVNANCFFIALWLHAFNYLFVYFEGLTSVQLQVLVLFSIVFIFLLIRATGSFRLENSFIYMFSLLMSFVIISFLGTFEASVFVRMLNLFLICFFAYVVNISKVIDIQQLMKLYTLLGLAGYPYLAAFSMNFDIRNDFVVSPNYIGLIVLSVALSATFVKNDVFRFLVYLSSFYIADLVSSRATIVCLLAVSLFDLVYLNKYLSFLSKKAFVRFLYIFFAASLLVSVYSDLLIDLLMIDDQYRGIDSGLSGRAFRWDTAISEIFEHPFIGVGYGHSTDYLGFTIDNAYLTALLELGWFGGVYYIFFLFFVLATSYKTRLEDNAIRPQLLIFFVVFIVYGLFEKRYLSVGNSFSLIFLVFVFRLFVKRTN